MNLPELGYPEIPKSITNSNVSVVDALDYGSPLSFLTFIKLADTSFNPTKIQDYYSAYLKVWNYKNNIKESDNKNTIVERYREFIEDVNLRYTTIEERKFLEQLDFNDPLDLDVAIPFYSKKLIEIANYYNKKREDTKFQITKKQIKSTNFGTEKEIREIVLNYLENYDDDIGYNFEDIKKNLEIEIEEIYDINPYYFNQTPNDLIYDNKDLDYGLDIFLRSDTDLINEVFSGVSDQLRSLKESDQLFDNKRKLTQKSVSTDFYYLSTGSTVYDFVSGKIFEADKPIGNFFNINYPTTASTEKSKYKTPREMGFFRPHKTSILLIDGKNDRFTINFENLEPNTIYYFPDPNIKGKNGDVLTFISNDFFLKRNESSGNAKNQPTSKKEDSKYYGYISQIEITPSKYLDKIFESGYIQDSKSDLNNNLFGLFKNDGSFKQTVQQLPETKEYFKILNGHTFYDYLYGEGYNFDYTVFDDTTYISTIRSGLSTHTESLSSDFSRCYRLYGGFFDDKKFVYPDGFLPKYQLFDSVGITNDGEAQIDTISSDLSAYPNAGTFYYSKLIENGIYSASPLQRALLDPLYPSLTANATQEVIPDGVNVFLIDGGKINSYFGDIPLPTPTVYYDPTVLVNSTYTLSSSSSNNYFERFVIPGSIYVRNSYTKEIDKLTNSFGYLSSSLATSVYNEVLSGVRNFELVKNTLFIETDNNLIISEVKFSDGVFVKPQTPITIINFNDNPFQKISKRYKKDDLVLFSMINVDTYPTVTNNFKIYPTIYEYNVNTHKKKEYTPDISTQYYTISSNGVSYVKTDTPTFTYDSRDNIYNTSFLLKDSINNFRIVEFDFKMNPFAMSTHKQIVQK